MYKVCVFRHGSKCEVVHTFSDFGEASEYYARKLKQGVDMRVNFDIDMYACYYDRTLQRLMTNGCVATSTWHFDS